MKIAVHIDRLVVDGVRAQPHQARRIHEAMERELFRLLGEGPPLPVSQSGALPAMMAPQLSLPADAAPAEIGREIARSLHGMLTGSL